MEESTPPTTRELSPSLGFSQRFLAEMRETGETGKKQWEEILTRWREQLAGRSFDRATFESWIDRTKTQVGSSLSEAQSHGAELLLKLVTRVKESAGTLEARLAGKSETEVA